MKFDSFALFWDQKTVFYRQNQLEKLEAARSAYLLLPFLIFGFAFPCLSFTGLYFALLNLTGSDWAILSLMGLNGPYWALLGLTGTNWALLGLTRHYWALPKYTYEEGQHEKISRGGTLEKILFNFSNLDCHA